MTSKRERIMMAVDRALQRSVNADLFPPERRGDAWEDPLDRLGATADAERLPAASRGTPPRPIPVKRLRVRALAGIESRDTAWLWERRIARGTITLLDGDPGLGKSFVTLDLASRVSRAYRMPPEVGPANAAPGTVLLLNAEDDPARTIRPRLEELGADLSRIHVLTEVEYDECTRPPVLPDDLEMLEAKAAELDASLIIIDPLMAYLGGSIDAHKDADIRRVLHGIKSMAERTQAAVVLVRHLNKLTTATAPIYRGGGSIGIIGAARTALLVGRHPDDPDARVLCRTKGNLSAEPRALVYQIEATDRSAIVSWRGEADISPEQLLQRRPADEPGHDNDDALVLGMLDRVDPRREGTTVRKLRDQTRFGQHRLERVIQRLLNDGIVETVTIHVPIGTSNAVKTVAGVRRFPLVHSCVAGQP